MQVLTLHCCTTLVHQTHVAAQEDHISNFQVANRNSTHITFSWDIADDHYSDIRYFRIFYNSRTGYYRKNFGSIEIASTDRYLAVSGLLFQYTTNVTRFGYYGQYIMWVRVHRPYTPYFYSKQIGVEVGKCMIINTECEG